MNSGVIESVLLEFQFALSKSSICSIKSVAISLTYILTYIQTNTLISLCIVIIFLDIVYEI